MICVKMTTSMDNQETEKVLVSIVAKGIPRDFAEPIVQKCSVVCALDEGKKSEIRAKNGIATKVVEAYMLKFTDGIEMSKGDALLFLCANMTMYRDVSLAIGTSPQEATEELQGMKKTLMGLIHRF